MSLLVLLGGVLLGVWALVGARRSDGSASAILGERMARGEITTDEYRERLSVIQKTSQTTRSRVPLAVSLVVLGIVGTVASSAWADTPSWDWMGDMMDGDRGSMMSGDMMDGDRGSMMSMMQSGPTERSAAAPRRGAPEQRIVSREFSFSPSEITLQVGEPTNVELENQGHMFHTFTVPELDFDLRAQSGESITGALTVEDPGTYEFICAVPQHAEMGMRGRIVVSN